jgi:hypothetical protein
MKFPTDARLVVIGVNYVLIMDGTRQIVLQKSEQCFVCNKPLSSGTLVYLNESSGRVSCTSCLDGPAPVIEPEFTDSDVFRSGTPGGSAQREFERRRLRERQVAERQRPIWLALVALAAIGGYVAVQIFAKVLDSGLKASTTTVVRSPLTASTAHGLGVFLAIIAGIGMARALWGRRKSTTAWATGARGERVVATRLANASSKGVSAIHDRRIPGSRANIDHIAVGPAGIYVIDAKVAKGKVSAKTTGPIFNRGPVKLFVGGHERTKYVDGMDRQVEAVARALKESPWAVGVPIKPMVVLVGAEWGWFPRPVGVRGVWVGWPKEMTRAVSRGGSLSAESVRRLAAVLASQLPEA